MLSQGHKPLDIMVIEVDPNEESDAGESDSTESYDEDQCKPQEINKCLLVLYTSF